MVESDLEGPTIPAVFRIASDSGTLKVCTMIFRWSGALFKGDKAKVKGKRIKQDIVVLDQDGHYIYTAGEN